MRTIILNTIFFSFLLSVNLNAQTVNVCIGTDTLSSNYPFTTYWMDGRTDMLYLGSEIISGGGGSGYFTAISFYVNHADTLTMNGFNVKILSTVDTALSGFGESWEICYNGSYKIMTTGWQTIYLTQPYAWNGNNNIVIEICYDNNRYTWFSTVRSTVKTNKTYGRYTDLPGGNGCVDITTGTLQTRRPNICIAISPLTGINNNTSAPVNYSLSQNYPNPFNPETRINYSVPKSGPVKLLVYDALGRQISELVNGYKNAGNYIVEFDASALSSGMYYYKMTSGEFSDIKKMILVK